MKETGKSRRRGPHEILYYPDYEAKGGTGDYARGVLSTDLRWSEFHDEVRRFQGHRDYVWRGQRRHGEGMTIRIILWKAVYISAHEGTTRQALGLAMVDVV